MNKILWTFAFIFSLLLGQNAFAHSEHCGERIHKMVESLHLTAAQKEKVKPILTQLKTTMKANVSQMRDLSKQIDEQVTSATADQSALDGLVDKKSKLIGDMMKAKIDAKHQIYGILDAKQQKHYQDMMKHWEEKMASKYKHCKGE